jgi:hypothetical protein
LTNRFQLDGKPRPTQKGPKTARPVSVNRH